MTNENKNNFKQLFSQYCQEELDRGHCSDGDCAFCPINRAYQEIFPDGDGEIDTIMDALNDALMEFLPDMEVVSSCEQALVVRDPESGVTYRISVEEYNTDMPESAEQTAAEKSLLEAIQAELEEYEYDIQDTSNKALVCQNGNKPEFLIVITEQES